MTIFSPQLFSFRSAHVPKLRPFVKLSLRLKRYTVNKENFHFLDNTHTGVLSLTAIDHQMSLQRSHPFDAPVFPRYPLYSTTDCALFTDFSSSDTMQHSSPLKFERRSKNPLPIFEAEAHARP